MWKPQGGISYFAARQPTHNQGVANGIVAILVIQIGNLYKAVGIEAQRPGLDVAKAWDNKLAAPNYSRFHSQLRK
ncbi:hypothetical protein I5U23_21150 [Stenotrophomonas maltophilia]|uniref:Uncharacterized protein n=1 Tax=Stenotrophomonas riyadhensis TaxID=2859893 RepID=A0ABT2XL23_9GAMM|nr:hypothetical protein [Stenotrophomonas sp. CFS3442]MBH1620431.1 hypothetical protein [Stenotrophomonas maltophilia]MCV0326525.1 hypothetical protein [Stenotrophomonas sp. CFS3442]HEL4244375.1 hypothetical protein [Stenotrophomonas maltophilia]